MARYPKRFGKTPPTHPGEILREDVLPTLGLSVSEAARELGISRQMFHRVLSGRAAVSPEMALRIGKFCGNGPEVWLRLQQAHDLWHAERALGQELKRIQTHKAA
jgi:addiction module HigA family antidote